MGFWDKWFGSSKSEEEPSVEMLEAPEIEDAEDATEAEPTDAAEQLERGMRYRFGDGVPEDHKKAFVYFKKASEQGFAKAYFMLGNCYHFGIGTEQNYEMAVHWFKQGAEQGVAEAQHNLADAYETGRGVKKDMKKAMYWYGKASAQYIQRSTLKVALLHIDGFGGKRLDIPNLERLFENLRRFPKGEEERELLQEFGEKLHALKHHTETPSEGFFGINLAAVKIWLKTQQAVIDEENGGKTDAGH